MKLPVLVSPREEVSFRDAEVREIDVIAGLGDQEVGGRLDVPMDEAAGMSDVERSRGLLDQEERSVSRKRSVAQQQLPGMRALDEAHDEVEDAAVLLRVVDREDVRVLDEAASRASARKRSRNVSSRMSSGASTLSATRR